MPSGSRLTVALHIVNNIDSIFNGRVKILMNCHCSEMVRFLDELCHVLILITAAYAFLMFRYFVEKRRSESGLIDRRYVIRQTSRAVICMALALVTCCTSPGGFYEGVSLPRQRSFEGQSIVDVVLKKGF